MWHALIYKHRHIHILSHTLALSHAMQVKLEEHRKYGKVISLEDENESYAIIFPALVLRNTSHVASTTACCSTPQLRMSLCSGRKLSLQATSKVRTRTILSPCDAGCCFVEIEVRAGRATTLRLESTSTKETTPSSKVSPHNVSRVER